MKEFQHEVEFIAAAEVFCALEANTRTVLTAAVHRRRVAIARIDVLNERVNDSVHGDGRLRVGIRRSEERQRKQERNARRTRAPLACRIGITRKRLKTHHVATLLWIISSPPPHLPGERPRRGGPEGEKGQRCRT